MSPAPGTYTSAQSVTLSDTTPGALIYYTLNGTTPTTSSAQYSPGTPLQISSSTTVEAIAVASGYSNSAVTSGTYTITAITPAASPTMSPAPGTYTSAQSVTLSDTTPGALIYYTLNGSTPTTSSAQYSPGTPLQISSSTTVEAIAVASGYSNSAVTSGTYTINSQGTTPISVNLSSVDSITAIGTNGSPVPNGGLDGGGNAYSVTLLGTSLNWNGSTFTFGAAGSSDAVSSITIPLPAGNDIAVNLLATAVGGSQINQPFVVTYTDGTTSSFTQSLSD